MTRSYLDLEPEEYMLVDPTMLSPEELREFSYILWACFSEDEQIMAWREQQVLPLLKTEDADGR